MKVANLRLLRTASLCLLLPGLAGLIAAASMSTHYLLDLPRMPVPSEERMTPRSIDGTVVYETEREDTQLSLLENGSVAVFAFGLVTGMVYLRKWGISNALGAEDEEILSGESS